MSLPTDSKGNVMQMFRPHPDSASGAGDVVSGDIYASYCHSDGALTYSVNGTDYSAPHIEGQHWGIPGGTESVKVDSGTFSFSGSGLTVFPTAGLLMYADIDNGLVDSIGESSAEVKRGVGLNCVGGETISFSHLTGSEAVTSKPADCTSAITVSPGTLTLGAGTLWGWVELSDGTKFSLSEGAGTTIVNAADNSKNGTLSDSSIWAEFVDGNGFDLNLLGYSARENYLRYSENFNFPGGASVSWYLFGDTVVTISDGEQHVVATNTGAVAQQNGITGVAGKEMVVLADLKSGDSGANVMRLIANDGTTTWDDAKYIIPDAFHTYRQVFSPVADCSLQVYRQTTQSDTYIKNLRVVERIPTALYSAGDSICAGAFHGSLGQTVREASYSNLYAARHGFDLENSGVGGETLASISARVITELGGKTYPIIILEGGTNTILNASSDPSSGMINDASAMIEAAKTAGEVVVFIGVPNCPTFTTQKLGWVATFNGAIAAAYSGDDAVSILDIGSLLDINDFYTDGVHPLLSGHVKIESLINSTITAPASCKRYPDYITTTAKPIIGNQAAAPDGTSLDVLGKTLQYPGRIKYNLEVISGTGPTDWVVKLPQAPELISILGLGTIYFDASGVPLSITFTTLMAQGGPVTFGSEERECWAVYNHALTDNNLARANKYFNVGA